MAPKKDDPQEMEKMRQWLGAAATELDLDQKTIAEVEQPLLGLIGTVAHGPSRPGAPLSAYLVGVAVGRGADPEQAISQLTQLAESYPSTGR
ncbi:DUF6457 domain-containing protein [Scrofimicrobium sp. R131]|uniref:DUF6457 domain-containing protein n=1 Tax=Scrofimicrobium appendicitidis TaxID=3079930 RepID=A0AAU7V680_9ACTO